MKKLTAISAKECKKPQNGAKENSPGEGSPDRGNVPMGRCLGIAVKLILGCCFTLALNVLHAQTIAEKKSGLSYIGSDLSVEMQQFLDQVNHELDENEQQLQILYSQIRHLYSQNAEPDSYREQLEKINAIKTNMSRIEEKWREMAMHSQLEGYALWHQPNTTLEQLVIDYGAQDYVYLISPEIAGISLSINSNLPIPRASWDQMLELILAQNGVGIKQLNPYLRELYLIREDRSGLKFITNNRNDIAILPDNDRIAFLLTPEPSDVRRVWSFLEKFTNHNSTVLQVLGRDILIVARVVEIQELLKLYDFALAHRGDRDYRVIPLSRVDAEEMAKILDSIFGFLTEETDMGSEGTRCAPVPTCSDNGLKVIPLGQIAQAIFLVGTREELRKAENLVREVEGQVGEATERVIYWYGTKHSDPEELAQVLEKIYALMASTRAGMEGGGEGECCAAPSSKQQIENIIQQPDPSYDNGFSFGDNFVVNKMPPREAPVANQDRSNFLVDLKTGSIVMVVEAEILPKLKDVIKKLDVPKKMVQLEVLLFEKKTKQQNSFGLNLLRIGHEARNKDRSSVTFNDAAHDHPHHQGVFEFLLSNAKHSCIPAYDIIYKFLLTQDDIQINASPSVLAINQTPATIEIAEEISVNTGIYEVGTNAGSGVALRDSFARAQYGIKIGITPTIHMAQMNMESCIDDCPNYVTLSTDITFQTFSPSHNNRPDVTTRHIVNEVRVPDGQTVILGGLRNKTKRDRVESVPFLGEIPGIGKFFSMTEMHDDGTEMFIFITPKIILDPCEQLEQYKLHQMALRPGDIPEFLCALERSWECAKRQTVQGTLRIIFGRTPERCIASDGEYDGR